MANHWYDQITGAPKYQIERSDGKGLRDVTLKDARKLKLVPSVTTVSSIIAKPQVDQWKLNQLFLSMFQVAACKLDEPQEQYKTRLFAKYQENIGKYSKIGNEVHDKLENIFTTGVVLEQDMELLLPVVELIEDRFCPEEIIPEKSFAHKLGYGGKIDLIIKNKNRTIIIDFKTKQGAELEKIKLYDDYAIQLAAYRQAIDPKAECYNCLISVTDKVKPFISPWDEGELTRAWKMFTHLLEYWKLSNNYDPAVSL